MKILLVSFSVNGAIGDYFANVAKYLAVDNELFVLTNEGVSREKIEAAIDICNVRFDRHKPLDFVNPYSYFRIYRFVKSIQYDVCFIASFHPINFLIYSIIDNRKIIPFVHDHILHSGSKGLDYHVNKRLLTCYYQKSARIIVSCNRIKNDIIQKSLMSDADKISVVYLGLLENHLFPIRKVEEDIDVLFFGRIEHYKGLDILVNVARKMPHVNFCIVGKRNPVYEVGITYSNNIKRVDVYVPDEELSSYIQRSKIVVLPYRDATGTQTIQTISYYRKPIIATNVGCFPEYLDNEKTGIIIERENELQLENAIEILLSNGDLRKKYGENAYEKLETVFSNCEINERYLEVFRLVK